MFGFEGTALSNYIYFTALGKTKFFLRLYEVKTFSSIAQSVEHSAVNRSVVGSSPTWGARKAREHECLRVFLRRKTAKLYNIGKRG